MMWLPSIVLVALTGAGTCNVIRAVRPTTTSSCSESLIPTPPPKLRCGQQGTLSNPDLLKGTTVASQDACLNYCTSLKHCVTFGYDASTGSCDGYGKPLTRMGFQQTNSGAAYYSLKCYQEVCPTPTCPPTAPTDLSFNLQAVSNSSVNGLYAYINTGSGHLHWGEQSEAVTFTYSNGLWQAASGGDAGDTVFLDTSYTTPLLIFDTSDPSGDGALQCGVDCNNNWVCSNAMTGASEFAVFCNGDTDDHVYFTTSDQAVSESCFPVTATYIPV